MEKKIFDLEPIIQKKPLLNLYKKIVMIGCVSLVDNKNTTVSLTDLDLRYRDDYFCVGFDHFWPELRF
jgi:hypothetical protein